MTEFEAMVLSAAIEAPAALLAARLMRSPGRGYGHVATAAALATAATHPQLWAAALWLYPLAPYWLVLLGLEGLVVIAEGAIIAWIAALRPPRATAISLLANSASLLVGLALRS